MLRSAQALTYLPGKDFLTSYLILLPHTEFHGDDITDRPAPPVIHISNVYLDLF